jgi:tetratricopeptide (TPR) repeat protein
LGWILFKKHQYREALSLLRDSAAKNQNDPDIQFHYGMAAYVTGDESSAASALAKVAQSKVDTPLRSESQRRMDFLSLGNGGANPDESRIKAFLSDYPDDPVALKRLSELAAKRADIDGAIQGFEKLLSIYPEFAPAARELTLLYADKKGNNAKALEVALRARQNYPADPEVGRAVGILQFKAENYPRAIELLKEVVNKRPEDATAYYFLGKSYQELKDRAQCKAALERSLALKLEPQFADDAKSGVSDCTEQPQ